MNTTTWKRAEFKIAVNARAWNGGNADSGMRTGYVRGPFAIHAQTWSITHVPTGLKLCDRATKLREAKEIASALLPLADWSSASPMSNVTEERRVAIRTLVLGTKYARTA